MSVEDINKLNEIIEKVTRSKHLIGETEAQELTQHLQARIDTIRHRDLGLLKKLQIDVNAAALALGDETTQTLRETIIVIERNLEALDFSVIQTDAMASFFSKDATLERRLPIILLVDDSTEVSDHHISQASQFILQLQRNLLNIPEAVELGYITILSVASPPSVIVPFVPLLQFHPPILIKKDIHQDWNAAIEFLNSYIDQELITSTNERRGDYKPVVFGLFSRTWQDNLHESLIKLRNRKNLPISDFISFIDHVDEEKNFSSLSDKILTYEMMHDDTLMQFFRWVSASIAIASKRAEISEPLSNVVPPPEDNAFKFVF
jgi:uncharacterized protein YegL